MNAKRRSNVTQRHRSRSLGRFAVTICAIGAVLLGGILFAIVAPRFARNPSPSPPELPASIDELDQPVAKLIREQFKIAQSTQWDANAFGELGLFYEANKLWQNAYDAFRSAVQLSPNDKGWRLHLAISAHETENFAIENDEIQALVAAHPDFVPAQHRYGQQLLDSGDLIEAAARFERVIDLEPSSAEGYVGRAEIHLRQGEAKDALPLLQRALEIDQDYKVAHYLLGSAYRELGREQEATRHLSNGMGGKVRYLPDSLSKRMEQYTVNLKARTTHAANRMVAGGSEPAAETFEEVLRADPENVTVMNNLAGTYVRLNRIEEAEKLLKRALKMEPDKYSTHVNMANIAVMKGQLDEALAFADTAVELAPRNGLTHRARASVLFRLGRLKEAYQSAETVTRLNPSDIGAHQQCADLALRLKDFELAIRHFGHTLEHDPKQVDALVGLARAHWALGHTKPARDALTQAATLAPNDRRVKTLLDNIGLK